MNRVKSFSRNTFDLTGPRTVLALMSALIILWSPGHCLGQGTLTIAFDDPPQPPGTYINLSTYSESGVLFVDGPSCLMHVGSSVPGAPDNGTAYLGSFVNTTVAVNSLSGTPFSLSSFDVAGFYGLLTPPALYVIGYRQDGTMVTNDFSSLGLSFQTVHFDAGFVNLNRIELTGGFAFDNVVLGVPEPTVGGLIVLGGLSVSSWRFLRRKRSCRG